MVVISTKKYSAGDLICSELPFVHAVDDEVKSYYCDACICPSDVNELKKCSGCKHMFYCSKECQKKDWVSGHKYECDVYKHHFDNLLDARCRLLLRLYFVFKNNKQLASQKADFQYDDKTVAKSFEDLPSYRKEIEKDPTISAVFFSFILLYKQCNIKFNHTTMFDLFCKCSHNSNELVLHYSYPGKCIGTAIFLGYSAFRHSCSPNICRIRNGMKMEVRASKEINIGDEIFTRLIQIDQDKESRQKELKQNYFIDCNCQKCSSDFDKEIDYKLVKWLQTQMDMYENSFPSCLQMAIQQGRKLVPLYKKIFGYDAFVTFFLKRMYELLSQTNADKKVLIDILNDTVKNLEITHGVEHKLYKEFKGYFTQLTSTN